MNWQQLNEEVREDQEVESTTGRHLGKSNHLNKYCQTAKYFEHHYFGSGAILISKMFQLEVTYRSPQTRSNEKASQRRYTQFIYISGSI